jgi:hypothetical protein
LSKIQLHRDSRQQERIECEEMEAGFMVKLEYPISPGRDMEASDAENLLQLLLSTAQDGNVSGLHRSQER